MASFLTTNGISFRIEELIMSSNQELILVTPYLKLSQILVDRLIDASNSGTVITIIYGKQQLNKTQKSALDKLDNLNLYFLNNLHAKCYLNEKGLIICSMNLYDYSEKNNREMGIFINRKDDESIYENVRKEVNSIINASSIEKESKKTSQYTNLNEFEIYKNILSEKHPNEKFILSQKTDGSETIYSEITCNNFMKSGVDLCINHRIEFSFRQHNSVINKIYNNLDIDKFSNEYRIFWDSPDLLMTIYYDFTHRDKWNELDAVYKINYYYKAIITLMKEIKKIIG